MVVLVHSEAGQEPLDHQHSQGRHQSQLCIPEMHNTGCIVPFGLLATL